MLFQVKDIFRIFFSTTHLSSISTYSPTVMPSRYASYSLNTAADGVFGFFFSSRRMIMSSLSRPGFVDADLFSAVFFVASAFFKVNGWLGSARPASRSEEHTSE